MTITTHKTTINGFPVSIIADKHEGGLLRWNAVGKTSTNTYWTKQAALRAAKRFIASHVVL